MLSLLLIIIIIGTLLEIISLCRNLDKIEFHYSISNKLFEAGNNIEIKSLLTNNSFMPFSYLAIIEMYPITSTLPDELIESKSSRAIHTCSVKRISGYRRKIFITNTSISERGVYSFRTEAIRVGDFFGFKERIKDLSISKQIIIYPKKLDAPKINDALNRFCGDAIARRHLIRDPILTTSLREYTGNEPLKEIHWLQSARKSELIVREFEYNQQVSVNILLYVNGVRYKPDEKSEIDNYCSIVRAACEIIISKNIPIVFYTNAYLVPKENQGIWKCDVSLRNTELLLETLGRILNHEQNSLEELLCNLNRTSDLTSMTIVFMPNANKNDEDLIKQFGYNTGREVLIINEVNI